MDIQHLVGGKAVIEPMPGLRLEMDVTPPMSDLMTDEGVARAAIRSLLSWNLTDGGREVPPELDRLPPAIFRKAVERWLEVCRDLDPAI